MKTKNYFAEKNSKKSGWGEINAEKGDICNTLHNK